MDDGVVEKRWMGSGLYVHDVERILEDGVGVEVGGGVERTTCGTASCSQPPFPWLWLYTLVCIDRVRLAAGVPL
jgi:hypothetical protein